MKRLFPVITKPCISRRRFVSGFSAGCALMGLGFNSSISFSATSKTSRQQTLQSKEFNLDLGYQSVNFTATTAIANTVNGSLPAPILRWREGDRIT